MSYILAAPAHPAKPRAAAQHLSILRIPQERRVLVVRIDSLPLQVKMAYVKNLGIIDFTDSCADIEDMKLLERVHAIGKRRRRAEMTIRRVPGRVR